MLDQPGLMAMDVAGVALFADALAGADALDEQSLRPAMPSLSAAIALRQCFRSWLSSAVLTGEGQTKRPIGLSKIS